MSKFYCNICDEDVTLQNGKCPKCKTDWKKVVGESFNNKNNSKEEYNPNDYFEEDETLSKAENITDYDIKHNIELLLTWANIGKIFMIIIAVIIAIIGLVCAENTDGASLVLLIVSIGIGFYAIIFENNLKWKAYLLHTNNKNKEE